MQSAKETAANMAASAKAGMEKTKATAQEKAERMTTRDPLQKEMATEKKDERIHEAERQKHEARAHSAATRQAGAAGGAFGHDYTTGGRYSTGTTGAGYTAETGVRADYPGTTGAGYTAEQGTTGGVVEWQYPAGQTTGGAGRVGHQDQSAGPGARTGYGTGNTY